MKNINLTQAHVLKGITWDHVRGYDPMVATSERFAECNPDTRIIWHKRSLQAFADRPLEDMASDYDLIVIDHPHVGAAVESGMLLQLDNQGYDVDLRILAQQSCGISHSTYQFGGHQWGLAIDAASPVSAYRPDLIEIIPESWSDVVMLADKGQVIWPLCPINALMSFYNLLASIGKPFGNDGIAVDEDTGIYVLSEMLKVSEKIPGECFFMDPVGAYEWLSCRSTHSYIPYLYGYTNYSRQGFRPYLVKVADIPALGNNGPVGSPIGGTGIAISASCKNKDIALKYAFWIASAECQRDIFFQSGGQPANISAWHDKGCNQISNNFFHDTIKTLEMSSLRPQHNGYMHFQEIGGDLIHACLTGQRIPVETVVELNEAYERSFV